MSTNNTLISVINFAATHAKLVPLCDVGGYTNEPALSICNDALSSLLSSPYDWRFNANDELAMLVTATNKQDYLFAGATAFTLGATSCGASPDLASKSAITVSGGVVTVNTLETHRFTVGDTVYMTGNTLPAYNSTYFDTGSASGWNGGWVITAVAPKSFSFAATSGQNNSDVTGAPGITDFGWLCSATMVELNNTSSPQNTAYLSAVRSIQPMSKVANPDKVSIEKDLGTGVLKVRFSYVPGSTVWGVTLVYQVAAPVKTDLSNTWAPFPDNLSAVYRQAVIYYMYRYLNDSRSEAEYQKLQQEISKAQGYDDSEQSDVFICPADGSVFDGMYWGM
jgi:hypothetical protein